METECILCGGCSDVCPVDCIEILPLKHLTFSENSRKLIADRFKCDPDVPQDQRIVLIKNEKSCIRCGLCAKRCPTGAVTMEGFEETYDVIS